MQKPWSLAFRSGKTNIAVKCSLFVSDDVPLRIKLVKWNPARNAAGQYVLVTNFAGRKVPKAQRPARTGWVRSVET